MKPDSSLLLRVNCKMSDKLRNEWLSKKEQAPDDLENHLPIQRAWSGNRAKCVAGKSFVKVIK